MNFQNNIIFSIDKSKEKTHYIITILGIKLKLRIKGKKKSFKKETFFIKTFQNKIKNNNNNSVLIVELNVFHREIMPGFVKYFQDLGYSIDILTVESNDNSTVFCRYNDANVRIFTANPETIRFILKSKKILKSYNYIFVNSYSIFRTDISIHDFLKYVPIKANCINKWVFVCHDTNAINKKISTRNKFISLADNNLNLPIVNPNYFGNVKITEKNNTCIFLLLGDNNKTFDFIKGCILNLLKDGYTNFKVYVTGRKIHEELSNLDSNCIEYLGYVDFEKLYDIVEQSDFLIANLMESDSSHDWYINNGTSGIFQLCYGFVKPMIIVEKFAKKALVDEQSSIVYKNDTNLTKALKEAINMNEITYRNMQQSILCIKENLYKKSLVNLRKILERNL